MKIHQFGRFTRVDVHLQCGQSRAVRMLVELLINSFRESISNDFEIALERKLATLQRRTFVPRKSKFRARAFRQFKVF